MRGTRGGAIGLAFVRSRRISHVLAKGVREGGRDIRIEQSVSIWHTCIIRALA